MQVNKLICIFVALFCVQLAYADQKNEAKSNKLVDADVNVLSDQDNSVNQGNVKNSNGKGPGGNSGNQKNTVEQNKLVDVNANVLSKQDNSVNQGNAANNNGRAPSGDHGGAPSGGNSGSRQSNAVTQNKLEEKNINILSKQDNSVNQANYDDDDDESGYYNGYNNGYNGGGGGQQSNSVNQNSLVDLNANVLSNQDNSINQGNYQNDGRGYNNGYNREYNGGGGGQQSNSVNQNSLVDVNANVLSNQDNSINQGNYQNDGSYYDNSQVSYVPVSYSPVGIPYPFALQPVSQVQTIQVPVQQAILPAPVVSSALASAQAGILPFPVASDPFGVSTLPLPLSQVPYGNGYTYNVDYGNAYGYGSRYDYDNGYTYGNQYNYGYGNGYGRGYSYGGNVGFRQPFVSYPYSSPTVNNVYVLGQGYSNCYVHKVFGLQCPINRPLPAPQGPYPAGNGGSQSNSINENKLVDTNVNVLSRQDNSKNQRNFQ